MPNYGTNYDKDGVSFSCPEGWYIMKDKVWHDYTHHVQVMPTKTGQGGTMMIIWVNEIIELAPWMDKIEMDIEKLPYSDLKFLDQETMVFNGIEGIGKKSSYRVFSLQFVGNICFFHHNGRSFYINRASPEEDVEADQWAFKRIEESLVVNLP